MHRESFRSDVLVSFHPPIKISTKNHKDFFVPPSAPQSGEPDGIKQLTAILQEEIRQGTIDAPNFGIIRAASTARRIYAPFGTGMTLGDHVQVTSKFVDCFAIRHAKPATGALISPMSINLQTNLSSYTMLPPPETGMSATIQTESKSSGYRDENKEAVHLQVQPLTDSDIEQLVIDLHVCSMC